MRIITVSLNEMVMIYVLLSFLQLPRRKVASAAFLHTKTSPSLQSVGRTSLTPNLSHPALDLNMMDPKSFPESDSSLSATASTSISSSTSSSDLSILDETDFSSLALDITDNIHIFTPIDRPLKSLAASLEIDVINFKESQVRPIVCGHRGALYRSLENTRHSFLTASLLGCDEVELDVFLLKCGTLVVFHGTGSDQKPGWLKQYCNVEGSILDYSYEEVRNFGFNPLFEEFGCGSEYILKMKNECYIPTLEEVLHDAKSTGVTVKIELKGPGTADPVLRLVEQLDMVDQCHYSSFDFSKIKRIRDLRHEKSADGSYRYRTGALFSSNVPDNFIQLAQDVQASEVHLKYSTCTKSRVRDIHNAGMDSMAWFRGPIGMNSDVTETYYDVDDEDETMYSIVMATGVKNMCVNKCDVLINMLKV